MPEIYKHITSTTSTELKQHKVLGQNGVFISTH